jgi:hypothetical protein
MFGHDHVAVYEHLKSAPHSLQTDWEEVVGAWTAEEGLPQVTTKGDEVGVSGLVEPVKALRHEESVQVEIAYVSDV